MGRWRQKDTVEDHCGLDIRFLHRRRVLTDGYHTVSWGRDGKAGSIRYIGGPFSITLFYQHRKGGEDWEKVRQEVPLDWTRCHFGGERPWFICGHCGRRVAVLYGVGKYFACRHCYDLTYRSCQESDSRFSRFLRNPGIFGFGGWKNTPIWALKGLLNRSMKEDERFEKQMKKRRRGRPSK